MTEDRDVTRIETLRLLDYRRFAETLIDFDPRLTVLISPNGGGKTAILDALVAAWRPFVTVLRPQPQGGRLSGDDVRRKLGPERTMERAYLARLSTTGILAGQRLEWSREVNPEGVLKQDQAHGPWDAARSLYQQVIDHADGKEPNAPLLPLICYYGTGRLWNTRRVKPGKRPSRPTRAGSAVTPTAFRRRRAFSSSRAGFGGSRRKRRASSAPGAPPPTSRRNGSRGCAPR